MAKIDFDHLMSIWIDIGKDTFHLVGFDHDGQRVLRKQIKRLALIATFEKAAPLRGWHRSLFERALCQSDFAQDGL